MINKLNVLHIILSKGYSGSEKYACELANYQSKTMNTSIITLKKNYYLNNLISKNVNKWEILDFFKKYQINKLIKSIKPNIIHTHLGLASKLIKKSKDYKIITTLLMNYKSKYYKNCDAIITLNNSQKKEISKLFKGKIFKNYLWVNLNKVDKNKNKIRKELDIPKKNKIFGSMGRFHPQKGFDIIIEAFKRSAIKNTTLILVGNGHKDFRKKIKNSKNILLLGHVDNVSNYYNIFDLGIFASRWESFGYTLIEAMKFNLPLISAKHVGNLDWINKFNITKLHNNNVETLKKKNHNDV